MKTTSTKYPIATSCHRNAGSWHGRMFCIEQSMKKPAAGGDRSNQIDSIWLKNTNSEIYKEWMLGYISLTP
jgi:hypothetical protein